MGQQVLVGNTGFVGGVLAGSHRFDAALHSSDVDGAFGTDNDLVVYAGVPAAMFLANSDPEADLAVMRSARENLRRIKAKRTVLISSIAVYADSRGKNEDSPMDVAGLSAYGANRLQLENWVREDFSDAYILRLPALYGPGLKKNFLYDLHTLTPAMLKSDKYAELAAKSSLVKRSYADGGNGFYKLTPGADKAALRAFFEANGFNALAFTDSESRYQFYNLGRLWQDISTAVENRIPVLNLTTPPVTAGRVYTAVTGKTWQNTLASRFCYDLRSNHAALLGGQGGYLCTEQQELDDICTFMKGWAE